MHEADLKRRRFLVTATQVIGGLGIAAASVPFVGSMLPSSKALALGAPVEIDISLMQPGQRLTVSWRGNPIFVVNRPQEYLESLPESIKYLADPDSVTLKDPDYVAKGSRSIKENILVVEAKCTHLGCIPVYKPKKGELESGWLGGFFCPCHGSKYDLSGRVYKNVPAPYNLIIPPHKYKDDSTLVIGEEA